MGHCPRHFGEVGECWHCSAPPAVANAVLDALRPEGVRDLELPITADRIRRALHSVRLD